MAGIECLQMDLRAQLHGCAQRVSFDVSESGLKHPSGQSVTASRRCYCDPPDGDRIAGQDPQDADQVVALMGR